MSSRCSGRCVFVAALFAGALAASCGTESGGGANPVGTFDRGSTTTAPPTTTTAELPDGSPLANATNASGALEDTSRHIGPLRPPPDAGVTVLAPNATCAHPYALQADVPFSLQDTAIGSDMATPCQPLGARQLFYTVRVPAGERATIEAWPRADRFPGIVVRVLAGCVGDACEATAQSPDTRSPATATVENRTGQSFERLVVVSGASSQFDVVFDLTVRFEPLESGAQDAGAVL